MTTEDVLRHLHRLGMPAMVVLIPSEESADVKFWTVAINAAGKRVVGINADEVTDISVDGSKEQWQALLSGQQHYPISGKVDSITERHAPRRQVEQQGEQALRRYRHFKGGVYEVLGNVTHHEDLSLWVRYRKVGTDQEWIRPLAEFHGTVEVPGGKHVRRFEPIDVEQAPPQPPTQQTKRATCPTCGSTKVTACRCMHFHSTCENGHEWHYELRDGERFFKWGSPHKPTQQTDLPDDPVAAACLTQSYLAVADAMERDGWNVDDPHDTYQLALAVLRVVNILQQRQHQRVLKVLDKLREAQSVTHTAQYSSGYSTALADVRFELEAITPPGGDTDVR